MGLDIGIFISFFIFLVFGFSTIIWLIVVFKSSFFIFKDEIDTYALFIAAFLVIVLSLLASIIWWYSIPMFFLTIIAAIISEKIVDKIK